MNELHSLSDAVRIVDTLADLANEDLDLVAQALQKHTITLGKDVVVDIKAAQFWIARQIDARAFEH